MASVYFVKFNSIHENYSAPSLPQNGEITEVIPDAGISQNTNFPSDGLTKKWVW